MPELLLVGAGHAHLYIVKHAATLAAAGYRVRLLAPRFFDYSGVASATAAGVLSSADGRIDVRALAGACGVIFHEGRLESLDPQARTATAEDGSELTYDVLSVNIGSEVDPVGMRIHRTVLRVKPLSGLADLDDRLRAATSGATVTVVGGGSSGVELASHLAMRPDVRRVQLVESTSEVGADLPRGARRTMARLLRTRGVDVRTGCEVSELGEHDAACADGSSLSHDLALLATGLTAPSLVSTIGLGDRRGIPVRATLQHVERDEIYALGDCAFFTPHPLPRIGVHGVRQGPVLHASLLARLGDGPLPEYRPQRRALSILDLGGGVGLATRGRLWWCGTSALRLKRFIDRRWLKIYRVRAPE